MDITNWRKLIKELRFKFPIDAPVIVVRRPVKRDCGLTTFNGRWFRIRVNSLESEGGQIDALLHEWAHAKAIDESYCHKARWGELYGQIRDTIMGAAQ